MVKCYAQTICLKDDAKGIEEYKQVRGARGGGLILDNATWFYFLQAEQGGKASGKAHADTTRRVLKLVSLNKRINSIRGG